MMRGEKREHILISSRIIDWEGERAVLTATLDVTDRKNAEAALQESEERLKLAFDAASDGLWISTSTPKMSITAPITLACWGMNPAIFPAHLIPGSGWFTPDDIRQAEGMLFDYIEGKMDQYATEFRMQTKAGGWRWIFSRGKIVERDENNKPVRVVGNPSGHHWT